MLPFGMIYGLSYPLEMHHHLKIIQLVQLANHVLVAPIYLARTYNLVFYVP